ncbi:hypothetical protein GCM10007424_25530 [Flavobacterium suaedae]|uniref:Secretion system C-terminal sorting domain-containing protein n=1 Tax=Flavobacterium suaedae TaxID=1767027 RepID=A0ABQ1K1R8_9FLAO|nr:hypothetical protein GCM10007424_25530 [Flavobacterium suaedae]
MFNYNAVAQCSEPTALPYVENAESATVPELPECMYSANSTFASDENFETVQSVNGFDGNVFAYSSAIAEGMPEDIETGVILGLTPVTFNSANSYTISYKYAMSTAEGTIKAINVLIRMGEESFYLPAHENVEAGLTPSVYTSAPFTVNESGIYTIALQIQMAGDQGYLYMDDIIVEEAPAASANQNVSESLKVYPNPVQNEIYINNADGINTLELYTVTGQKVLSQQVVGSTAKVNTDGLSAGIYLLKALSGEAHKTIKVIKK